MASHEQLAWVQITGTDEVRLSDPGRMDRLVRTLESPNSQRPSSLLLIGRQAKNIALRELFPDNGFAKRSCDGLASLHLDNVSAFSDFPILFAESNPHQAISSAASDCESGDMESFPATWAGGSTMECLYNLVHIRLFCLFIDVICIFAEDFESFDEVVQLLESWAAAGSASAHFKEVRPRIVIVRQGDKASPSPTFDLLQMNDIQHKLQRQALKETFSSMKVLHLATTQISSLARLRRLKELLWREMHEIREIRLSLGCLYSATHLSAFFKRAIAHTAASVTRPFDFILASRRDKPVRPEFSDHMLRFLRAGQSIGMSWEVLMSYVASSILFDAYPPKMHAFDPRAVYDIHYRRLCSKALSELHGDPDILREHDAIIQERLISYFADMMESGKPAGQMHRDNMRSLGIDWLEMRSNKTCWPCLQRQPENPLSCRHAICNICVRDFGEETMCFDCQYRIDACMLCLTGKLVVGLRPLTAGLHVLSIDGGGTRGKIAIEILGLLQSNLGSSWGILDLYDVVFGVSVGGLIALMLGCRKVSVSECSELFDTLAHQLFPKPTFRKSMFARFLYLLRSWYHDGWYDAEKLESHLKEHLGCDTCLFDYVPAQTATMIGVIAATIDSHPIIIGNYNGSGSLKADCGYGFARPEAITNEVPTWLAARITSAAPSLFSHAYAAATGPVQDGAMSGHNNPVKIAAWESHRIEPSCGPDIVVSVGTGIRKKSQGNASFRHFLLDGCAVRAWNGFKEFFDGERIFKEFINGVPIEAQKDYKRLNTMLPRNEPAMDCTDRMGELRDLVQGDRLLKSNCRETIYEMLIKKFYFELIESTDLPRGRYHCVGMIRCRLPGEVIVELLKRNHPSSLSFVTQRKNLGPYRGTIDLCNSCRRYRKLIEFSVRDSSEFSILARSTERRPQMLSSFPQKLSWFRSQQCLDAPFGSIYHTDLQQNSCSLCMQVVQLGRDTMNRRSLYSTRMKRRSSFNEGGQGKKLRLSGCKAI